MRVLFSGMPNHGHLLPMLPLARAVREAGHAAAVVTSPTMTEAVAPLTVLAAGPALFDLCYEHERRTGDPGAAARIATDAMVFAEAFTSTRLEMTLDQAVAAARDFRPDVIVAEALDCVGPAVAAHLDVPWVMHAYGAWSTEMMGTAPSVPLIHTMRKGLEDYLGARGITATDRSLFIDPCPDLLQPEGWVVPTDRVAIRPRPHEGPDLSAGPTVLPPRGARARVLVSLGTVTLMALGDTTTLDAMIASLVAADIDVVVTVGVGGAALDASAPTDRVHPVGFTPLDQLLDGVDAVVSVAGAGTVLATLARGLPMVLLPRFADQPFNAARVAAVGAGKIIDRPEETGAAAAEVLAQASYPSAARSVAAAMETMDSPDDIVHHLTRLVTNAGSASA